MIETLRAKQDGDNRVVDFELSQDKKTVEIMEGCDWYFSVTLNKREFGEFIRELQGMHAQMVDE
jgi:hypothetical protein